MPTTLTTEAVERSTFAIRAGFTDESGADVTPKFLFWTLTGADGNIVNSRDSVRVTTPASSVTIALTGDDLAITNGKTRELRRLTLYGVYDSDNGTDLSLRDEVTFYIRALEAQG